MERTLQIIEDLRTFPCLWDMTSIEFKNRNKRRDSITKLAQKYGMSNHVMEKKLHNLKSQFRREYKKLAELKKSGYSPKCSWFGYNPLSFLIKGMDLKRIDSDEEENQTMNDIEDEYITFETNHVDLDEQEDSMENQIITVEEHQPSITSHKKEAIPSHSEESQAPPENRNLKRKLIKDPWVDEAYKILKSALHHEKDISTTFGEYIASKHRKYSSYTKSTVEHLINNILYEADIGKYDGPDRNQPSVH